MSPNDMNFYEYQLQMNINVFSFFDDEGKARYPLVISRKNHELWPISFIGTTIMP